MSSDAANSVNGPFSIFNKDRDYEIKFPIIIYLSLLVIISFTSLTINEFRYQIVPIGWMITLLGIFILNLEGVSSKLEFSKRKWVLTGIILFSAFVPYIYNYSKSSHFYLELGIVHTIMFYVSILYVASEIYVTSNWQAIQEDKSEVGRLKLILIYYLMPIYSFANYFWWISGNLIGIISYILIITLFIGLFREEKNYLLQFVFNLSLILGIISTFLIMSVFPGNIQPSFVIIPIFFEMIRSILNTKPFPTANLIVNTMLHMITVTIGSMLFMVLFAFSTI